MEITRTLSDLLAGRSLSEAEAEAVFEQLLSGALSESQIAALLTLIQQRGATVDELVGAARVMRRHVTAVECEAPDGAVVIDTCGTGGAPKTFNISTAVALVVAAAAPRKVLVAKHGNRSRSGRGSAEVLGQLGVNVDAPPEAQARCLREVGVCFCFAIHHHPAAKHAAPTRKALGFPTLFNILGPLTNPARASRQLIGIYQPDLVDLEAEALARLGAERAMVVHGLDGMDEISTTGPTKIAHVEGGSVRIEQFDAADLGVPRASLDDLKASTLDGAAELIRAVLAGREGPARDIVELNAGAALMVAGAAADIGAGMGMARAAIDSGAAERTLGELARISQER
ncbi:MAG: anthranilate phosphoribosyltransferase [Phycisphaerales bacterium JB039]